MTVNTNTAVVPYGFGENAFSDIGQEGMRYFSDSKPPNDSFKFIGYIVPHGDQRYGPSGYYLDQHHGQGTHIDIYV
jgi:hypothetical protein